MKRAWTGIRNSAGVHLFCVCFLLGGEDSFVWGWRAEGKMIDSLHLVPTDVSVGTTGKIRASLNFLKYLLLAFNFYISEQKQFIPTA